MSTTGTISITAKMLGTLFDLSYGVALRNISEVTHEESVRCPEPGGNCINWVTGHLVSSRDSILELLGREPRWTREQRESYKRGSAGIRSAADALPWSKIVADLEASQPVLQSALAALTTDQLAAPLPPDRNPFRVDNFGEQLAALNFHETYHAGQLGVLRRLVGRKGAIA